jgi:hypothetical protein
MEKVENYKNVRQPKNTVFYLNVPVSEQIDLYLSHKTGIALSSLL